MKTSAKILLVTLGAMLLLMLAGIIWVKNQIDRHAITSSGVEVTQTYHPEDFKGIQILGGFQVKMHRGEKNEVVVKVDENFQKLISVEVKDHTLFIQSSNIVQSFGAKIDITCQSVSWLHLSGGVRLESEDMINVSDFNLNASAGSSVRMSGKFEGFTGSLSAGSELNLSGSAGRAEITLAAGSALDGADFATDSCYIIATAGSTADILVNQYLEAEASAGSRIVYYGSPFMGKQNTSSGGMIRKK